MIIIQCFNMTDDFFQKNQSDSRLSGCRKSPGPKVRTSSIRSYTLPSGITHVPGRFIRPQQNATGGCATGASQHPAQNGTDVGACLREEYLPFFPVAPDSGLRSRRLRTHAGRKRPNIFVRAFSVSISSQFNAVFLLYTWSSYWRYNVYVLPSLWQ